MKGPFGEVLAQGPVTPCFYLSYPNTTLPGDANENTAITIPVPGGMLGPNGAIDVEAVFTHTNNANAKTLRVKFGGTTYQVYNMASGAATRVYATVYNSGSVSAQEGSNQLGFGITTNTLVTGAADTSQTQNLLLTVQKGTAGDAVVLKWVRIRITRPY